MLFFGVLYNVHVLELSQILDLAGTITITKIRFLFLLILRTVCIVGVQYNKPVSVFSRDDKREVHPFCLSLCLSVYLSISLSVCISLCLSVYLSVYLQYISLYHSVSLSICLSACVACLSAYLLF